MMWLTLAGAIVLEVTATLSLRASDGFRKRVWIAPVIAGYAVALTLLGITLALGMAVGVAYGIWAACGIAAVAVLAKFIFDDALTWMMAAGIALIIGGVLIIELVGGTH
ncbi:DMT family transporter [Aeromicrobium sp. CTD01-1L150]|uniref:DMT family transporter n=1 Tax=Aeromicrobium sp. CTD01-1L150 TaxID=3341830 RepID=UPI0035BFB9E9